MKRVQKVLLITAVPILLTIAFYGYHVYRAISLDEENSRTYSATALSFLTSSEEWDKVIRCNPWPKSLSQQRFDPKEYLEIGSIADVYYGRHDKFGKQNGFELKTRYEKDSLDDEAYLFQALFLGPQGSKTALFAHGRQLFAPQAWDRPPSGRIVRLSRPG